MDWAQVLVIILSIFLAIFLLLGIILVTLLIKVTRQIKSVTESAERTVGHIEGAAASVARFTSPSFLISFITKQFKKRKK